MNEKWFKEEFFAGLARGEIPSIREIVGNIDEEMSEVPFFFLDWYEKMANLSYLNTFIDDPAVREIIVHDHHFFQIERNMLIENGGNSGLDPEDYQKSLEIFALQNKAEWNYRKPWINFFIHINNSRFRAGLLHFSATPSESSKLFLRRLGNEDFTLQDFDVNKKQAFFFQKAVADKKNILISGATSSGKTAFLSSLIKMIPSNEHVVVLEDTFEIVQHNKGHTRLLAVNGKTLEEYCAYALRMRPDRIILGEMRSHEIVSFLLAMNTGHHGLMSTIHANSASQSLFRLSLLFHLFSGRESLSSSLIMKLICQGLDYVVHLEKRKIGHIIHVLGCEGDQPYFERKEWEDIPHLR